MGKLDLDLSLEAWRDVDWVMRINQSHEFIASTKINSSSRHHVVTSSDAITIVYYIPSECFIAEDFSSDDENPTNAMDDSFGPNTRDRQTQPSILRGNWAGNPHTADTSGSHSDPGIHSFQVGDRVVPYPTEAIAVDLYAAYMYSHMHFKSRSISLQGNRLSFEDITIEPGRHACIVRVHLHREEVICAMKGDQLPPAIQQADMSQILANEENYFARLTLRRPNQNSEIFSTSVPSSVKLNETGLSLSVSFSDLPANVVMNRGEILVADFSFSFFPNSGSHQPVQAFSKEWRVFNTFLYSGRSSDIFIRCQPLPNDMYKVVSLVIRVPLVKNANVQSHSFASVLPTLFGLPPRTAAENTDPASRTETTQPPPSGMFTNMLRAIVLSSDPSGNASDSPTATLIIPNAASLQQYLSALLDL